MGNLPDHQLRRWHSTLEFRFGTGIGALVLTFAGAAWAFIALANQPATHAWQFGLAALPVLGLITLSVRGLVEIAKQPRQDAASSDEARVSAKQGRRLGVLFLLVFALEAVSIAAAVMVFLAIGRPLLIPAAVLAIVGLHLVPIGSMFHMPIYMGSGAVLAVLALSSLLIPDENVRIFAMAMSGAAVFWVAAGRVLSAYTFMHPVSK